MSAEFDRYAGDYETLLYKSIKASGYDAPYFDEQKVRELYRINKNISGTSLNMLNFGCGVGKSEPHIRHYFPQAALYGADVSEKSLKIAADRNRSIANLYFKHFENIEDFNPGILFDIIFAANVFHHIPENLHIPTLKHLHSLLHPRGRLYIFEHNSVNPLTRKAFATCEFDKGCKMIPFWKMKGMVRDSGFARSKISFTLFFPKFLQRLTWLERYLTNVPIGAQYYITCSR
jgi:SAM-dependent methyltransferase